MTVPSKFRASDITRAVDATIKSGLTVAAVEVTRDGVIRILTAAHPAVEALTPLQRWERERGLG
jgi:isopentenyl diphosphate isomerase/L-lactate dehydrogenase-like FMN-dependent dehydrogenase